MVELTEKEIGLLIALADGATNKQLAQENNRCLATIKHWLTVLYDKLGASNRVHAVAIGYHTGILVMKGGDRK